MRISNRFTRVVWVAYALSGLTAFAGLVDSSIQKQVIETLAQPAWKGRKAGSPGGALAREWISNRFKALGLTVLEQPILGFEKKVIGVNVLGVLGSIENAPAHSCIMIGAHYDHLGEIKGKLYLGADDNASGVAALLELARLSSGFKGCAVFAAWDFEEGNIKTLGGVKGSKAFAKHPPFSISKIGLSITFDLLGGTFFPGTEDQYFIFGSEFSKTLRDRLQAKSASEPFRPAFASNFVIEPFGHGVPRSDYGPLRDLGIPYLFLSTGSPGYYHTPDDTPAQINYPKLAFITEKVFALIEPWVSGRENLALVQHIPPQKKLVAGDDQKLTADLIERLLGMMKTQKFPQSEIERIQNVKDQIVHYENPEAVPECKLQSAFFRILEVNHIKSPLPPQLARLMLFCGLRSLFPAPHEDDED